MSNTTKDTRQWYRPASEQGDLRWAERLIDKVIQRPHSAVCGADPSKFPSLPPSPSPSPSPSSSSSPSPSPSPSSSACFTDSDNPEISITDAAIPDCCWAALNQYPNAEGGSLSLKSLNAWSIPVYADFFFSDCDDEMAPLHYGSYTSSMEYMTFTDAVTLSHRVKDTTHLLSTCSPACSDPYRPFCRNGTCVTPDCKTDAISYCRQESGAGVVARMYCPKTCECDEPDSTNLLRLPISGCPVGCRSSPYYTTTLASKACSDEPANSQHLYDYAEEWRVQATGQITSVEVHMLRKSSLLPQLGCAGYVHSLTTGINSEDPNSIYSILEVCGGTPEHGEGTGPFAAPIAPLSFWCPVACKCAPNNPMPGCPTACLTSPTQPSSQPPAEPSSTPSAQPSPSPSPSPTP